MASNVIIVGPFLLLVNWVRRKFDKFLNSWECGKGKFYWKNTILPKSVSSTISRSCNLFMSKNKFFTAVVGWLCSIQWEMCENVYKSDLYQNKFQF